MWLQNCLQVHCVTTGLENDFQLPGLRTIICEGQIIVHRTGADPVRMNYPGHMYPLSTQLNTAFAKCFLADQAGSRAGLKRGSVYIETAILRSLRDRFGCKQFGNFLFLYGTALLDPPERYVELTDFYQQQEDEWRNTGLLEDRSSWLQLGDTVQVQHKSLTIELTDVLAFSPFDESALFWFDTLTGDMHGITDGSCIQLDWHLNPLHPNPPIRESESKIFYDFTKAYRAFIEQNGGTHLRRDTFIPQRFQASKAAAASDGHAVHF